jgi:hypothetical protein
VSECAIVTDRNVIVVDCEAGDVAGIAGNSPRYRDDRVTVDGRAAGRIGDDDGGATGLDCKGRKDATVLGVATVRSADIVVIACYLLANTLGTGTGVAIGAGVAIIASAHRRFVPAANKRLTGIVGAIVAIAAVEGCRTGHAVAGCAEVIKEAAITVITGSSIGRGNAANKGRTKVIGADVVVVAQELLFAGQASATKAEIPGQAGVAVIA